MEFILCLILFSVGLYAVLSKRNLVKIIIGISVMGYAINLLFILLGYRAGAGIPIFFKESAGSNPIVDPTAQTIALITITLGLAITILLAALTIRLHGTYKTLDITAMRKMKG